MRYSAVKPAESSGLSWQDRGWTIVDSKPLKGTACSDGTVAYVGDGTLAQRIADLLNRDEEKSQVEQAPPTVISDGIANPSAGRVYGKGGM